jgi:hypothetical protein
MNISPAPLIKVLDRAGMPDFDALPSVMRAAMSVRGILYRDGSLWTPEIMEPIKRYKPAPKKGSLEFSYSAFISAAVRAVTMAVEPVPATTLLGMMGLMTEAVPSSPSAYLEQAEVYFIPGAGYWRYNHYASPSGDLIYGRLSPQRIEMCAAFIRHGWPLTVKEMTEACTYKVSSRYLHYVSNTTRDRLIAMRHGMIFPAMVLDNASKRNVPISPRVARTILELDEDQSISSTACPKMYKMAAILSDFDVARVTYAWEGKEGKSVRVVRIRTTDAGREQLLWNRSRADMDEF